jgi:hypothetical protein
MQGSAIPGAEVALENPATSDKRTTASDETGSYSVPLLAPAAYNVTVRAPGFNPAVFPNLGVAPAETVTINTTLQVAGSSLEITVNDMPPLLRGDSSELASTIDSPQLEELPLPTHNFLQLLTLVPGVTAPITNNSAIGRNSPNLTVNGSRVTQNGYQINGVDAGDASLHVFTDVAVPASERGREVIVHTSLYDASISAWRHLRILSQ